MSEQLRLGALQIRVIQAMRALNSPVTSGQIIAALELEPSNTIRSGITQVLKRLVEKGIVDAKQPPQRMMGRAKLYELRYVPAFLQPTNGAI